MLLGAKAKMKNWYKIPGFSQYEISKYGIIRKALDAPYKDGTAGQKKKPGELIRLVTASTGYLVVTIKHDGGEIKYVGVHQLVAMTFHGPRPSLDHKANWYKNIRWGTTKDNAADTIKNGNWVSGTKMDWQS